MSIHYHDSPSISHILGAGTVLLVNDNPTQLDAMGMLLSQDGFSVVTAESAQDALTLIRDLAPDLIISDVVMPGMDGIELCRKLKSDSITAGIPVLLVSGLRYDDTSVMQGLEAGADEYLEIDSPPSLLLKKVERWITQRRESQARIRAELALLESEKQYRLLFENNPHPMWVYDYETLCFLTVNNAAVRHYGYSREEFLAMTVKDIRPTEEVPAFLAYLPRAPAEQHGSIIWKHKKRDGAIIDVEVTSYDLRFQGRKARLVLVTDVTERHRLEQQLLQAQKMEAVGRLAGGVAHDFNNLLTAIIGYTQILLTQAGQSESLRGPLEEIQRAGKRAASLTTQLLAFSRRHVLLPSVIDINEIVTEIEKMLRRLIGEDIDLRIVTHPDLGWVKADPTRIEQVIMNLAVNARDAMPKGGNLTIETANVDLDEAYARQHIGVEPGPYILLAISDTGVGIEKDIQNQVFEPFFTTKDVGKGTGLGLSTVYGIVKQSGGHIWFYSEPGHGTTFKVYLPRVSERMELIAMDPSAHLLQGTETVLLVEDDETIRKLTRSILRMSGYTVFEASNAEEALAVSDKLEGEVDLLVSDVVMPDVSGPDLARQLAKLRPEMKILFMSGYTDDAVVNHGVLEPGTAFLQKPFTPDALIRKVREVLDGSSR